MSRIRTLVATEFLMMGGLLAIVVMAFAVQHLLGQDAPMKLGPLSALLFATMPALMWLGYYSSLDQRETDPKKYLMGAYVLGALVAGPASGFLIEVTGGTTSPGLNLHTLSSLDRWIHALAIVGIAQEGCKYVVIRYTIYPSPEFDAPIDGVIYMSATGLGLASFLTYFRLMADGEIYLSAAAAQATTTALAHASFAGLLGYAMAHAKFVGHGMFGRGTRLAAGLVAAAICSGCFQVFMDAVSVDGMATSTWRRVAFSFGFAAGIFLLTLVLMRHLLAAFPGAQRKDGTAAHDK